MRSWGIEVSYLRLLGVFISNSCLSNSWRFGTKQRARNEMHYYGAMRYGKHHIKLLKFIADWFVD